MLELKNISFGVDADGQYKEIIKDWFCANNTGTQFFTNSVSDELLMSMREHSEKDIGRARDILRRMGLYQYRDAHPACLSGGQRQRLAIACALLSDRNILVLDEPTSGLDAANMRIIATELKTAAAGGRCVLVITHDKIGRAHV